ncbi:hypothetical protein BASA81_001979 [Batrachochytrium salamandrivorans]|nr:hypothetical protein BASA81_001979 [Batrachochytrium salamandrivorans]
MYCNLSKMSIKSLAKAVRLNTCIGGFTCAENPYNFPDGENYDFSTERPVELAIMASKAPITKWNGKKLPPNVVEARERAATRRKSQSTLTAAAAASQPVAQPLKAVAASRPVAKLPSLLKVGKAPAAFELDTFKAWALELQKQGFDSVEKLADLLSRGIKGFTKRVVLWLKARLNASKPIVRIAQPAAFADFAAGAMPPLPSSILHCAFMSHNWGEDNVNHKRVQGIVNAFRTKGWPMWFDDERLTGQVDAQITNGMDESAVFVVFITKAYVEKVASGADKDKTDWCYFEFNYASTTMLRKMIAVVMDKEMLDQTKWKGLVGARLGNALYIDYTSEDKFESACNKLAKAIAGKIAPDSHPNKKSKLM